MTTTPECVVDQSDMRVILVRVLTSLALNFDPNISYKEGFTCLLNAAAIVLAQTVVDHSLIPGIIENSRDIMLRAVQKHIILNEGKTSVLQ